MARQLVGTYLESPKVKRKGIHSKKRKPAKKYRGQGR